MSQNPPETELNTEAQRRSASQPSAYARAGVDIDAGQRAVALMKGAVARTHGPQVLGGIGGFGGLFRAGFENLSDPVLVASTDGVGTKTKVATRAGQFGGLGADIVNHCVNDILVQGARPLFFLDYVAMGRLIPERVADFVTGAAAACEALGVALLGGETAEMPGVYVEGELDIVGTIVGVVDRANLITGEGLRAGDVVIALPSAGLHTNGFSLARAALDGLDWDSPDAELGMSLQDALLIPHRSYLAAHRALEQAGLDVKAMSHITGGGLIDNPPRVLPTGLGLRFDLGSYTVPPLFVRIVSRSQMDIREAYRALNMGVGFLFMLPPGQVKAALETLRTAGEAPWVIGEVVVGEGVELRRPFDVAGADL
ncbi:phosphoribosylformylglycinamidine cyclo-ligase [Deinococcus detaillensis]|uniref:Phosphoribosylformylglycinamidine cyclo-ligase n=1 Tax=Deinococcus detaillensis TaxID=2592048 RepID=A0A553V2M4_9DEIO|nr:phosphoribosylformylglycinamidine cyclo-ligase [Deinococcus detaillensis]TSA86737.1 phosphoribosylformylglycinamidine cyclo-ligase [Deinococcus detaillensis]